MIPAGPAGSTRSGLRMIKTVETAVDGDPQHRVDQARRLPHRRRGADRRDHLRRPTVDRAPHPPRRPQAKLWPDWRHFCFITNRTGEIEIVEAEHRDHAVVEQVIADLKDQALQHFPSGHFYANAAWTVLAALAHNVLRWTQLLGLPDTIVRAARTLRRRLLQVPGRLTRHARGPSLHLPARWPWHGDYINALNRIRALSPAL